MKSQISVTPIAPTNCELPGCGRKLESVFVRGTIRADPNWYYLCPGCHRMHGVGTGPGVGYVYEKDHKGRFVYTVTKAKKRR